MKIKNTTIGLTLGLAAALSLGACGGTSTPAADNDAMMSSAGNDAMMSSEGSAMNGGDAMSSDAMSSGNAMSANDRMSSGDAMSKGGNDAMAADAPHP